MTRSDERAARTITIVIADDHPMYRDGVTRALSDQPTVRIVAETGDGAEALELIETRAPDIGLVDLRLPSRDGIAIAEAVRDKRLATRVMIVSAFEDTDTIYQAFDAGARAYLTKLTSPQALCEAILAVAAGGTVFPAALRAGLTDERRLSRSRLSSTGALSAREREVLRLIADGLSAPAVAEQLFVSVTTVKTHLQHIYDKLGVSDRAAAVAAAARRGLLD